MQISRRSLSVWAVVTLVCCVVAVLSAQQAKAPQASGGSVPVPSCRVDGTNHKVRIHERKTGKPVGSIGSLGRMAGQFFWPDAIAMDSLGTLYTGEVWTGKRVQKFNVMNGDGVKPLRPHE